MGKYLPIASTKSQALSLLELTERKNLNQMTKEGTRLENVLDFILTHNIELEIDIKNIKHDKMSDHDLLLIDLNIAKNIDCDKPRKNYCFTKISLYKTNDMNSDKYKKLWVFLKNKTGQM